ncbi:MAG: type II toxin-antitoxin system HicB family antitoxin [Planctomycetota bacterium]
MNIRMDMEAAPILTAEIPEGLKGESVTERAIPTLYYPSSQIFWSGEADPVIRVSHTFAVTLFQEEGVWVADVPALTSCVTSGKTLSEALANIKEALESVIAAFAQEGKPLPLNLEAEIEQGARLQYVNVIAE